jgi:hypothetical protein
MILTTVLEVPTGRDSGTGTRTTEGMGLTLPC